MAELELPSLALLLRCVGLFAILPLGFDLLSSLYRVFLAALCAFALCGFEPASPAYSIAEASGDVLVGVLIGLPAALVFHAAEWFGEAFDILRGQTIGNVLDPLHPSSTVTAQLCSSAAWAFLLLNGILVELVSAVAQSFASCPSGAALFSPNIEAGLKLTLYLSAMLCGMLRACLPFAFVFVALEISFAAASKVMPGMSLGSEAFIVKLAVGFTLLAALASSDFESVLSQVSAPRLMNLLMP